MRDLMPVLFRATPSTMDPAGSQIGVKRLPVTQQRLVILEIWLFLVDAGAYGGGMAGVIPTFFIAGFPKCGTTALDAVLRQHPDIAMAEPKEPDIFGRHHGDNDYLAACYRHVTTERVVGDATVTYVAHEEIAGRLPADARFVICLRDPIARAVSHYDYRVQRGYEHRPWADVVDVGVRADLIQFSCYATLLRPFWETFGAERFLFVDAVDRQTPEVLAFLGVDALELAPVVANVGTRRRSATVSEAVRLAGRFPLPRPVKDAVRPAVARLHRSGRSVGATVPTEEQVERLRAIFDPEMEALRAMTGVNLSR